MNRRLSSFHFSSEKQSYNPPNPFYLTSHSLALQSSFEFKKLKRSSRNSFERQRRDGSWNIRGKKRGNGWLQIRKEREGYWDSFLERGGEVLAIPLVLIVPNHS